MAVENPQRIWFLSSNHGITKDTRDFVLHSQFSGSFAEMSYIALPMNVTNYHWFMMVFSFVHKEIFVLDSKSGCGYEEKDITMKITQVHNMLLQNKEYNEDIREWSVSYMNDDVLQQRDGASCGPYMLFFMAHIRDLIPMPKKKFFVNESYLRIWIANEIWRSHYNIMERALLANLREFLANEGNKRLMALRYCSFPSVSRATPSKMKSKKKVKSVEGL